MSDVKVAEVDERTYKMIPGKYIRTALKRLLKDQSGTAFKEIVLILGGIAVVSIVVTVVFNGGSLFSPGKAPASNPSAYAPGPGAFTPVSQIENDPTKYSERVYSTVKGAITDMENTPNGDTTSK